MITINTVPKPQIKVDPAQNTLRVNLNKRIANSKFASNKAMFARIAGLKRDKVIRILNGRIKNPCIHTIYKLALVLNCSVDDLLGTNPVKKNALHSNKAPFDEGLFVRCTAYISNYLERNNLKNISTGKIMLALDSLYNLSYSEKLSHPNKDVADCICKVSLK